MIKVVHYLYHFLNQQGRSKVSSYIKYKFRGRARLKRLEVGVGYGELSLCWDGGSVGVNGVIVSCIFVGYVPYFAFSDVCRF